MDRNDILFLSVAVLAIMFVGKKVIDASFTDQLTKVLSTFIPSVEGFRSKPYWDSKRYSWGYGTQAPGPDGTITREQAFSDMLSHLMRDYKTLSARITRPLTVNQWAALLSFSYNEGPGNAFNLVPEINDGYPQPLIDNWRLYIYSDGKVNPNLVERREKEIQLWLT